MPPALRIALALTLLAGSGCHGPDSGVPPRPDVVVFVVDTLRADRLGSYGNRSRDASPVMDSLARDGVLFEQAITVAPRTWQSFVSILTGLYPPRHGVRFIYDHPLDPEIPTIATTLQANGYRTAAFDGIAFLRGMTQGKAFEEYVDPNSLSAPLIDDSGVVDAFVHWLGQVEGQRIFAFLKLGAPHWPYTCPDVFHADVPDHGEIDHGFNQGSSGVNTRNGGLVVDDGEAYVRFFYAQLPPAVTEHLRLHYDECVRYTDSAIGRALDALEERGRLDEALVVLTSDHGESFGEHGYMTHGPRVDEPVMHVPLIIRFPAGMREGRRGLRLEQQVRVIDIYPTVADVLEIEPPEDLEGSSLLPTIRGTREPEPSAYGESGRGFVGLDPGLLLPGVEGKWRMLRRGRWKLLLVPGPEGDAYSLYDLEGEGGETVDVAEQHPEILESLRAELASMRAREPERGRERELDEAEKERLRQLGYL